VKNSLIFPQHTTTIELPVYPYIPKFYLREDEDTIDVSRRVVLTVNASLRLPAELHLIDIGSKKVLVPVKFYYPDNKYTRAGIIRLLHQDFWQFIYGYCYTLEKMHLKVLPNLREMLDTFGITEEELKLQTAYRKYMRWKNRQIERRSPLFV